MRSSAQICYDFVRNREERLWNRIEKVLNILRESRLNFFGKQRKTKIDKIKNKSSSFLCIVATNCAPLQHPSTSTPISFSSAVATLITRIPSSFSKSVGTLLLPLSIQLPSPSIPCCDNDIWGMFNFLRIIVSGGRKGGLSTLNGTMKRKNMNLWSIKSDSPNYFLVPLLLAEIQCIFLRWIGSE